MCESARTPQSIITIVEQGVVYINGVITVGRHWLEVLPIYSWNYFLEMKTNYNIFFEDRYLVLGWAG